MAERTPDIAASVADILTHVADRFAIEITFRECKQVVGAGQQQVRHIWANIGAFHLCVWVFTMTEAWAWNRSAATVTDRSDKNWSLVDCTSFVAMKQRRLRDALTADHHFEQAGFRALMR